MPKNWQPSRVPRRRKAQPWELDRERSRRRTGLLRRIGSAGDSGIGPVIAAGPLVAALAGIGIGGALGGFAGSLIAMGIPEYEARRYEGELVKGGILVVVHCETDEETNRAKEVFQSSGAQDIAVSRETSSAGIRNAA